MTANKLHKIILTSAILLVLFRLLIFGLLTLFLGASQELARYFVFLPVLIVMSFYCCTLKKIQTYQERLFSILITVTIFVGVISILALKIFYSEIDLLSIIIDMSRYNLFLIFPLLLLRLPLNKDDYRGILDTVAFVVLSVGGLLMFFEAFGYFLEVITFEQTYNFIGAEAYKLRETVHRPLGLLGDCSSSGILLSACTVYYFVQKISLPNSRSLSYNKIKYSWTPIIIGFFATILAAALMPILIMLIVMLYATFKYTKVNHIVAYILFLTVFTFLVLRYAPQNPYEYLMGYIENIPDVASIYLPSLSWAEFPFFEYNKNLEMNAGEFHFFNIMVTYGFLPFIPWMLFIISPLAKILRLIPVWYQDRAPMMLCLVFLLAILHYSGLERWGSNYVYILALCMLFVSNGEERRLKQTNL